jgi:hypothetical protein
MSLMGDLNWWMPERAQSLLLIRRRERLPGAVTEGA